METKTENRPPNGTVSAVGSSALVSRLRAHSQKLAAQLAECAGYLASVRTDRRSKDADSGETWALQTLDWAQGAEEIAERSNALLDEHDSLDLDAFLAECETHIRSIEPPPANTKMSHGSAAKNQSP